MTKSKIPTEWDLKALPRYKRTNMELAMKGKIERGLVELVTNSDDNYGNLEDDGQQVSGKIRIEIERRKKGKPSIVRVRDRAGGMNREEMFRRLGFLGGRTSGFEKGKSRRGLHGRGAKDTVAFGTVHFESIKNDEYNHLTIFPSLKCCFKNVHPKKASPDIRKKLGMPKGNGTVVTVEVESNRFKIPQHETLVTNFSRYYSLRDIFSNPKREVKLVDLRTGREDPLIYSYPIGKLLIDKDFIIPEYPRAIAHVIIRRHVSSVDQQQLPYREGILIKSAAAIHDCTYFGLESEPFSWRFTGELYCEFIDELIREYDDREETNPEHPEHPESNPQRLLNPHRDGLIGEHPFAQALHKRCREILQPLIEELKAAQESPKREVSDENLEKRLDHLSKELSKIFEKKLIELEEEIPTVTVDDPRIKKLAIGLHIIPAEEFSIVANEPKTFSIVVKHFEALDESLPVSITTSEPDTVKIHRSPVFLKKFLEDGKVGRTTFTVEGSKTGTEAFVEARYGGYESSLLIRVIEPPPPLPLPQGLSFEKPLYHLRLNKEKNITLRLNSKHESHGLTIAEISSNNPEIIIKAGGRCKLRATDTRGLLQGECKVVGRQLKATAVITARLKGFGSANTSVIVEEREPVSGVKLKFEPVEDDFGTVRYKWDEKNPYLLKIGAIHPSIRRYLGEYSEQGYPGINSAPYRTILAEVIAEALSFRILEKLFKSYGTEGMLDYASTDAYYHKSFSEFLVITHRNLHSESVEE